MAFPFHVVRCTSMCPHHFSVDAKPGCLLSWIFHTFTPDPSHFHSGFLQACPNISLPPSPSFASKFSKNSDWYSSRRYSPPTTLTWCWRTLSKSEQTPSRPTRASANCVQQKPSCLLDPTSPSKRATCHHHPVCQLSASESSSETSVHDLNTEDNSSTPIFFLQLYVRQVPESSRGYSTMHPWYKVKERLRTTLSTRFNTTGLDFWGLQEHKL